MEIVFLGVNDIGLRIYEWLSDRESTDVVALLTEKEQLSIVSTIQPDLIASVGFDYLVPPEILEVPSKGAINLHPSLLPYNRGKSPNVWPLVEKTPAGVTLHYMDDEFDTGNIIAQKRVQTNFEDSGKDLHKRLEEAQFNLFTREWPNVESGKVEATSQKDNTGTHHSKNDFIELCELDPDEEIRVKDFLDRLRALTFPPFDNAYLEIDNIRYYVDIEIRKGAQEKEDESEGLLSSY